MAKKKRETVNIYQCSTLDEFTEISDKLLFTTGNFFNPTPGKTNYEIFVILDDIDDCRIEKCSQCNIWYRMGEYYDNSMKKRAVCSHCRHDSAN